MALRLVRTAGVVGGQSRIPWHFYAPTPWEISSIEREIDALNVDTRATDINARRDRALDRLRSVLGSR